MRIRYICLRADVGIGPYGQCIPCKLNDNLAVFGVELRRAVLFFFRSP